ncbi:hypothetical protein GGU11DRAFT_872616 [Lentinula aff. detonsa]|nr:hypothetical protein GGU11DRAFT_872616 [Lentinula aff. detonsa]
MIPGSPPIYVHELIPQLRLSAPGKLIAISGVYIREGDGIIMASNSAYEGETMCAVKSWFREMGKNAYAMAPLILPSLTHIERDITSVDEEASCFLERTRKKFGRKSLVYISFGTFAYPPQPEKLQMLIKTLIDHQVPFLFSYPSPQATEEEVQALIKESGIGMAMQWCPQEEILQHDVTGWFITHGGWNSVQESLEYRVPLIFWPISADQPLNAAQVVLTHKAAFELIEVRSGKQGTKPLLRFQNTEYTPTFTVDALKKEVEKLIEKFNGKEGQTVRTNFEKLSDKMRRSWEEGGECKTDFEQFIQKYVDCM